MRNETTLETEWTEDRPPTRRSAGIDRRSVLEAATVTVLGMGLAGCTGSGSSASDYPGPTPEERINNGENNYYSWFVEGGTGFRKTGPFLFKRNENKWVARATADGGIRCRIENSGSGTAGFELSVGPLGKIDPLTIQSRSDGDAKVFYALYLDKDDNGEFYRWKDEGGNRQRFTGYGKDKEAVGSAPSGEEITIESNTELIFTGSKRTTLGELQQGKFQGIGSSTATALFVGVLADASDKRELVIENVDF